MFTDVKWCLRLLEPAPAPASSRRSEDARSLESAQYSTRVCRGREVSMARVTKYLDNPAWHALTGPHAALALGDSHARCYPRDVAPFVAVASNTASAFASLARLIEAGRTVVLVGGCPERTDSWRLVRRFSVVQMMCDRQTTASAHRGPAVIPLSRADVPAMLRLTQLTQPGPFLPRTIELGTYVSIQHDTQLVAMAGLRFHLPGYREISAVCTHPSFRRRGYGARLVRVLVDDIQRAGDVPFLHVVSENSAAITLYESLGFVQRAELNVCALERQ
jgi:predicted GNAT family acetyltransferase